MIPSTCPDCGEPTYEKGMTRFCPSCQEFHPYTAAEALEVASRNELRLKKMLEHRFMPMEDRILFSQIYSSHKWMLEQLTKTKEEAK